MKYLFVLLLSLSTLFGALQDKSAIVYYGENISYPMVGIHDYIIVQPELINTKSHGFSIYKDKMYAYVSVGEIDSTIKEYKKIDKSWILAENKAWKSKVLDLKNVNYLSFLFQEMIIPRMKQGFKHFFFDTLDSYQLASKTKEDRKANEQALVIFINEFHSRFPDSKLIINRGFEIIDRVHDSIEAVLFESYYAGIGGEKLAYKKVSDSDRGWLDIHINKIKSYGLNVICLDYLQTKKLDDSTDIIKKIKAKGMIPYIANRELNIYGKSSKNAIKREIFTLINEKRLDRTLLEAHQHGGLVLEYMGYIQKLHDTNKGFPSMNEMRHYNGVIIWLQDYYKDPKKLIKWVKNLISIGQKVVFANNFGFTPTSELLAPLEISITKGIKNKSKIAHQDEMIAYEIEPSLSVSYEQVDSNKSEPLLVFEYEDGTLSTPAAITSWGGYAIADAFMVDINKDNIWVVNPFEFFKQTLSLKTLIVPDVTTENGKRLLFTHIDGDGIMNRVEGDYERFSGDVILEEILKAYKIPHSVSVIGAEIDDNGLFPKISSQLQEIAKQMYALPNVEPATHTFTHPFYWNKIIDGNLSPKYRLKPKGYRFSLDREIRGSLADINSRYLAKDSNKKAQIVFWSGDCAPPEFVLDNIYSNNILNINGGDTIITKTKPWLSGVAPLGLERGSYYQIYTGAQNENVFTNDWLGPFWGFKRVVQTFKLTNSPRRFKPIDIYYHIYSGSKMASIRALKYVFDWAIKQDTMPIYTSEYIPKVMDFYTASMAQDNNNWLVEGMIDLKTIRIEKEDASVDFKRSITTLGIKHFENHTYISLDNSKKHYLTTNKEDSYKDRSYLISSNAKIIDYKNDINNKGFIFNGHVDLKLNFYLTTDCKLSSLPKAKKRVYKDESLYLYYKDVKKAEINIKCK